MIITCFIFKCIVLVCFCSRYRIAGWLARIVNRKV